METLARDILSVTEALREALAAGDFPAAEALLARRADLLHDLDAARPADRPVPEAVLAIVAQVQALDLELGEALAQGKADAARELQRLNDRGPRTKKHDAEAPCFLNRRV